MKAMLQLYTKEGSYGPPTTFDVGTVKKALEQVIRRMEEMPDTLEGIHQYDWTKIELVIER